MLQQQLRAYETSYNRRRSRNTLATFQTRVHAPGRYSYNLSPALSVPALPATRPREAVDRTSERAPTPSYDPSPAVEARTHSDRRDDARVSEAREGESPWRSASTKTASVSSTLSSFGGFVRTYWTDWLLESLAERYKPMACTLFTRGAKPAHSSETARQGTGVQGTGVHTDQRQQGRRGEREREGEWERESKRVDTVNGPLLAEKVSNIGGGSRSGGPSPNPATDPNPKPTLDRGESYRRGEKRSGCKSPRVRAEGRWWLRSLRAGR